MLSLSGPIRLDEEGGKRRVVNGSELELRDAILIDQAGPAERVERWLGTIAAGASVEIDGRDDEKPPERVDTGPGPDANPFLCGIANQPGVPRRKPGRDPPGGLGGRPGTAGKSLSQPSIGIGASLRLSSTCVAAARPAPTAGGTTGSLSVSRPSTSGSSSRCKRTSPPSMQRRGQGRTTRRLPSPPPVGARSNQ